MPSLRLRAAGTFSATAASQRLMNSEATELTRGSRPASMRRSMPRVYASAAARYCLGENSSVTLTGTPAKIDSSIAVRPSTVPGILMNRFCRPPLAWRRFASLVVASLS